MSYIVENPDITHLTEIMNECVNNSNKKYYLYQIRCVLKVKDNQKLSYKPMLNLEYTRNPNIIIKNQPCLSQVNEMRVTLISSYIFMKYDY